MKHQKKRKNTITQIVLEHIANNIKAYAIVTILFLIGTILGVIFVNNASESQQTQIGSYLQNFVNALQENYQIDQVTLLKQSLYQNTVTVFVFWFLGCTVIGIPMIYLLVGYRGFAIGYSISSAIATFGTGNGILFVLTSMFLQNILVIPCILALAVSGMKLYESIMKDKRRENIKVQIIRHTVFSILILLILGVSSLLEVYVSSNLLNMAILKM